MDIISHIDNFNISLPTEEDAKSAPENTKWSNWSTMIDMNSFHVNMKNLEAACHLVRKNKIPSLMVSTTFNLHLSVAPQNGYGNLDMDAIVLAFEDFRKKHGGV